MMKYIFTLLFLAFPLLACAGEAKQQSDEGLEVYPFGDGGQLKMIYDRRSRPQGLFLKGTVYLVYNGGAPPAATERTDTYPFVTSFDLATKTFSKPIQLSKGGGTDQHFCPIIWADKNGFFHILYGCHKTPGTHLIAKTRSGIGKSAKDWAEAPPIRHSLSYPTVYTLHDNNKVITFRTGEHRSSWSYLISKDACRSWIKPDHDAVDLNMGGDSPRPDKKMENELSSYQTTFPSRDGRSLHVIFCHYDDNKQNVPEKFWNPRYKTKTNLGLKYNLYAINIDLQTHAVTNFEGRRVKTPVDFERANALCKIWDTDWRGAGVPPDIILDENDNPAMLHVLSEETPETFNYYYVRYVDSAWKQSVICPSNDDWNSCYLQRGKDGRLYACILNGPKLGAHGEKVGKMDSRGGGRIELWSSSDKGSSWRKVRDLTPGGPEYEGWKFNNIQPIKDPGGKVQDGMLLFYGWKDSHACKGKAFLVLFPGFERLSD